MLLETDVSSPAVVWDEYYMCQWHRSVIISYAVTISTLEASLKTLLYQSLSEGRKSDVPRSIWEETSQCRGLLDFVIERHRLLIPFHSSFVPTCSQTLVMHTPIHLRHITGNSPIVLQQQTGSQHAWQINPCL